jgi:hypothetical protein
MIKFNRLAGGNNSAGAPAAQNEKDARAEVAPGAEGSLGELSVPEAAADGVNPKSMQQSYRIGPTRVTVTFFQAS